MTIARLIHVSRQGWRSFLVLWTTMLFGGCEILGVGGEERYIIWVDSIVAPSEATANSSFPVRFFGTIGQNGCALVDRIERHQRPDTFNIRFHGINGGGDCPQMVKPLEHTESIVATSPGSFTIQARQPEGPPLESVVQVR